MEFKKHKVCALAVAGALVIGATGGAMLFPRTITETKTDIKTVEKEVLVEVPGPVQYVTTEVVKEVKVDNGNLGLVLSELIDKDGSVEYLTDDLDDDEMEMIVDRLVIKNDWEAIALNKTRAELYDELDKEVVDGTELDEDDLRSLVIESEDITFENIDWDDKDAEVVLTAKFRQEDEKFQATVRVFIREDEFDELVVESVTRR